MEALKKNRYSFSKVIWLSAIKTDSVTLTCITMDGVEKMYMHFIPFIDSMVIK